MSIIKRTFNLPNSNQERFVVTHYQNVDGDWYRIWNDGWLEQGYSRVGSTATITFLKSFKNTSYTISGIPMIYSSYGVQAVSITSKTKTGITWAGTNYSSSSWYVCGIGDVPTIKYKRIIKF